MFFPTVKIFYTNGTTKKIRFLSAKKARDYFYEQDKDMQLNAGSSVYKIGLLLMFSSIWSIISRTGKK